ncbi:MAG: lipid-A-disaccharide synthase [Proteobacteria bacterium]|jgi:lipid-A-disaccharide synthase|nr:lipid-A-disaccharide synthase [Pseudomonadota bacterium]
MTLKIAIIAGEPSGDMLAAQLISTLKVQSVEPIEFLGIGGEQMALQGFTSLYPMDTLSIGGYGLDVLSAIPKIYLLYRKVCTAIIDFKPDVFIGVDAPDFNFHVEKKLHKCGIKTIHYVSPTIWGWRYERIFKIKKTTDLMLCIFPMEEDIYKKENIKAKFVGNPLANKIDLEINSKVFRKVLQGSTIKDLDLNAPIFTVLVGSRVAEIKKLAPIFIGACGVVAKKIPNALFLFPFANKKIYDAFILIMNTFDVSFKYHILLNQTSDAIKACDVGLVKSGTVSLEVALCKKPMVISYKVSKFTEWLVRQKIKIKYVGLPNILLNEEVAKELLQDDATADKLANEMLDLYENKDRQEYIIKRFYELHRMLKENDHYKAANTILEFIKEA